MADLVKQAASGEVFLHESLNDTEKEYLLEVSGQITTTIQRAAVRVGFYLLEVKERFRTDKAFSGPNGWFQKWYTSKGVGLSASSVSVCINAATLSSRFPELSTGVELLDQSTLIELTQPNARGGTSTEFQKLVLTRAIEGNPFTKVEVKRLKKEQKILALQEYLGECTESLVKAEAAVKDYTGVRDGATNSEYKDLCNGVSNTNAAILTTKSAIEKLLNAPDPVAEEPKEESTPTPPEPVVIDPNPALQQQLADLQKQLEESEALAAKVVALEEAKRKLQLEKKAAEDKLHQINLDQAAVDPLMSLTPERRKGALQAHIAEFRKGCHTLSLCRQYDDGGLPGISQLEGEVVDAIKDWLHVLSPVAREDLTDALYQSTALTPNYSNSQTINVQALN